ncbi:hypothetical protein [Hymenobacter sp. PAMC 26628]|uniref:hypothetical protein n=1 Tax=Hymenobacter sp. PAMC 26628 TaxID=1484118 RepID=UPI0007700E4E|nr:hypothetical protein [Hymenobacter sp. PAMC 26628]AMJ66268.1 hypothetical protein AXW84_13095 [Hymenobacter sp. PAMC 26628]
MSRWGPSAALGAPAANLAAFTRCPGTEEKAQALRTAVHLRRRHFNRGEYLPYPTAANVCTHRFTADEELQLA